MDFDPLCLFFILGSNDCCGRYDGYSVQNIIKLDLNLKERSVTHTNNINMDNNYLFHICILTVTCKKSPLVNRTTKQMQSTLDNTDFHMKKKFELTGV